jgi:hypothetical protein
MKRLILALALASSPLAAFAACSGDHQQAMSCAENTMWDEATRTCVPIVTG